MLVPCGELAASGGGETVTDSARLRVYAPNQGGGSISVLDGTGEVLSTVDLAESGLPPRSGPHDVAVSPDGSAWYVSLSRSNLVAKFDSANRLVASARFEAPGMVALDPAHDRLYVSRGLNAVDPPSSLGVFRTSDLSRVGVREVFVSRPHALAVNSATGRIYTASLDGARIAALDLETGGLTVTDVDGLSSGFVGMDTSPDGETLVASTQRTDELIVFRAGSPRLRREAAIPVAAGPYDVIYSPDGRSVWFPNQEADAITRVDTRTWAVSDVIRGEGLVEPHGVAVSPDSRTVYVSSHGPYDGESAAAREGSGSLVVIDASGASILRATAVVPNAAALGLGVKR